jgi:hypothetical protein
VFLKGHAGDPLRVARVGRPPGSTTGNRGGAGKG